VALAWLLHNPAVTSIISGHAPPNNYAQRFAHPHSSSASETLTTLDKIWPGPGGEAPEAYAW